MEAQEKLLRELGYIKLNMAKLHAQCVVIAVEIFIFVGDKKHLN